MGNANGQWQCPMANAVSRNRHIGHASVWKELRSEEGRSPDISVDQRGPEFALNVGMKESSEMRKQVHALHARAIRFSNNINQSYPAGSIDHPSRVVWNQLVRAGDGTSNNLFEADGASPGADFVNKMRIALKEAKESKACLTKIRLGPLANADRTAELGLEGEADELCAIYATIIMRTERRLAREETERKRR
jgi:four helix bundle protein